MLCPCFPCVAQYLSCPFPANLGKLERLEQLDLTMNDLTGLLDKEVVEGACPFCTCLAHLAGAAGPDHERPDRLAGQGGGGRCAPP